MVVEPGLPSTSVDEDGASSVDEDAVVEPVDEDVDEDSFENDVEGALLSEAVDRVDPRDVEEHEDSSLSGRIIF